MAGGSHEEDEEEDEDDGSGSDGSDGSAATASSSSPPASPRLSSLHKPKPLLVDGDEAPSFAPTDAQSPLYYVPQHLLYTPLPQAQQQQVSASQQQQLAAFHFHQQQQAAAAYASFGYAGVSGFSPSPSPLHLASFPSRSAYGFPSSLPPPLTPTGGVAAVAAAEAVAASSSPASASASPLQSGTPPSLYAPIAYSQRSTSDVAFEQALLAQHHSAAAAQPPLGSSPLSGSPSPFLFPSAFPHFVPSPSHGLGPAAFFSSSPLSLPLSPLSSLQHFASSPSAAAQQAAFESQAAAAQSQSAPAPSQSLPHSLPLPLSHFLSQSAPQPPHPAAAQHRNGGFFSPQGPAFTFSQQPAAAAPSSSSSSSQLQQQQTAAVALQSSLAPSSAGSAHPLQPALQPFSAEPQGRLSLLAGLHSFANLSLAPASASQYSAASMQAAVQQHYAQQHYAQQHSAQSLPQPYYPQPQPHSQPRSHSSGSSRSGSGPHSSAPSAQHLNGPPPSQFAVGRQPSQPQHRPHAPHRSASPVPPPSAASAFSSGLPADVAAQSAAIWAQQQSALHRQPHAARISVPQPSLSVSPSIGVGQGAAASHSPSPPPPASSSSASPAASAASSTSPAVFSPEALLGQCVRLAKTHTGSRFMQQMLDERDPLYLSVLMPEMSENIVELSCDNFGSAEAEAACSLQPEPVLPPVLTACCASLSAVLVRHFAVEKLISACSASQVSQLLSRLAPHFNLVACQKHGSFACQAIVDALTTEQQIAQLIDALQGKSSRRELADGGSGLGAATTAAQPTRPASASPGFSLSAAAASSSAAPELWHLCTNASGHFVVLRLLSRLPADRLQFLDVCLQQNAASIGCDHHGLRVVKAYLASRPQSALAPFYAAVVAACPAIVATSYGNYVIQAVLDSGDGPVRSGIKQSLQGQWQQLSRQKFSSNVVEKCLRQSSAVWRSAILSELCRQPTVAELLRDRYANYVLQTGLAVAEGEEAQAVIAAIAPHLPLLRDNVRCKWRALIKRAEQQQQRGGAQAANGSEPAVSAAAEQSGRSHSAAAAAAQPSQSASPSSPSQPPVLSSPEPLPSASALTHASTASSSASSSSLEPARRSPSPPPATHSAAASQ